MTTREALAELYAHVKTDPRTEWHDAWAAARAALAQPEPEPVEMSPEFTDTSRAALLWVLWHHQGGSSPVGQPLRFALGMGQHDRLNDHQIAEAKRWAAQTGSTTADFHAHRAAPPPPAQPTNVRWCEGCTPDNCAGCHVPLPLSSSTLPPPPAPEQPALSDVCAHGIHMLNGCGACIPPRGTQGGQP